MSRFGWALANGLIGVAVFVGVIASVLALWRFARKSQMAPRAKWTQQLLTRALDETAQFIGLAEKDTKTRWGRMTFALFVPTIIMSSEHWTIYIPAFFIAVWNCISIIRYWLRDEDARETIESTGESALGNEDYRNEAIFSALILVFGINVIFYNIYIDFNAISGAQSVESLLPSIFVLGEFLKAVPLVDASEVYGWKNVSGRSANGIVGLNSTFFVRVIIDVLIIAAVFRLLSIYRRTAADLDLRKLDAMLLGESREDALKAINKLESLAREGAGNALERLNKLCLGIADIPSARLIEMQIQAGSSLKSVTERRGELAPTLVAVEGFRRLEASAEVRASLSTYALVVKKLGGAVYELGQRTDNEQYYNEAIQLYRHSAKLHENIGNEPEVASSLNNLGTALSALGKGRSDPSILADAVSAYERSFEFRTFEDDKDEWAVAANNTAAAHLYSGSISGKPESIKKAIDWFEKALSVRTKDQDLEQWAITKGNIAAASGHLYLLNGDLADLDKSISNFELAFDALSDVAHPIQKARAADNLGSALRHKGKAEKSMKVLMESANYHQFSSNLRPFDSSPSEWARSKLNLADSRMEMFELCGETEDAVRALSSYRDAKLGYSSSQNPTAWTEAIIGVSRAQHALTRLNEEFVRTPPEDLWSELSARFDSLPESKRTIATIEIARLFRISGNTPKQSAMAMKDVIEAQIEQAKENGEDEILRDIEGLRKHLSGQQTQDN